jgi:hypothetical protein
MDEQTGVVIYASRKDRIARITSDGVDYLAAQLDPKIRVSVGQTVAFYPKEFSFGERVLYSAEHVRPV